VTQGTPHKTVVSDGDDPNHFDSSYFGKGLKWQLPDLEGSEKSYRVAKQAFEESGRRIIDATVNGRCQVFPKKDYQEVFKEYFDKINDSSLTLKIIGSENNFIDYHNQCEKLLSEEKYEEAITLYQKALQLRPDYFKFHYNLGKVFYKLGKYEQAIASFEQAAKLQPDEIGVYQYLGDAKFKINDFDNALKYYQKLLNFNPNFPNACIGLGNVFFINNQWDEAIKAYKQGLKIEPQQPVQVYENLGECLARKNQLYPRLLVIDWTKTGDISATGQIKEKLLAEYPTDNWLQLYVSKNKEFKLFSKGKESLEKLTFLDRDSLVRECKNFNPSVIYYRPVADNLEFHNLACEIISCLRVPLVTHVMDDWIDRPSQKNSKLYLELKKSFCNLLNNSATRLSIGERMSEAFEDRYGLDFIPIANCIDVNDWLNYENNVKTELDKGDKKTFTVRYIGGLADDMNFDSISDLVEAIEKLAYELSVKLEIYTMKHWQEKAIEAFSKFTATTIYEANLSQEDYYQLLKSADALIVAYNFDANSITYTRYSIANKLPECLASGVPTLVYGPLEVATVEYAAQTNCVQLVNERNQTQLIEVLRQLINNYDLCKELGQRARQFAFEHHKGSKIRKKFYNILSHASLTHSSLSLAGFTLGGLLNSL
jgi:tetratricopeptide (TPR) repeat protein